jgi:hypothetical protein
MKMWISMRLKVAVRLADRLHPAGSIIEVGVDAARHLWHQRRAMPASGADADRLADAPRLYRH